MRFYRPRHRVVPITSGELGSLLELYQRCGTDGAELEKISPDDVQVWLEGGFELWQIQKEEKMIGAMRLTFPVGACWLDNLVVDPDHRRRGYGRSLVDHAMHRARRLGASRVWVRVEADTNSPALAFYSSIGFIQSGYHHPPTASSPILLLEISP